MEVEQGAKLNIFITHCLFPNNGMYQSILLRKLHNTLQDFIILNWQSYLTVT